MNNQTHRILSIKIKISYKRINFKSIKIRSSFLQYKKIANSIQTIMQNYNIHNSEDNFFAALVYFSIRGCNCNLL